MAGRRAAVLVLTSLGGIAGLVGLTSCGGEDVTVSPEAVADAAERTAKVDGMRFSLRGEMEAPGGGTAPFTGGGVSDRRGQRGRARMDMSALARQSGGEGLGEPGDWKMEMVFDRRFFYLRFPLLERELDGKSWLKFDVIRVAQALGIEPSLVRVEQQQGSDPASTLRYLRTVSDEVEKVGTEDVRGVQSTHYRATAELRKYPELVPAAERAQARRSVRRLIQLYGDDEFDTEIWVGRDKLIRRMKWTQSMKVQGTGRPVDSTFTTDLYDFGAKVSVEPPPDDEVKDVTDQVALEIKAGR